MKTDADLARFEDRLYRGEKVKRTEWIGLERVTLGEEGSANHKIEGAAMRYGWCCLMPAGEVERSMARQHLLVLLTHQLKVGIWSVPGPRGPVSEAMSVSHGKHHLRGLAFATWASWKVNDAPILELCRQLWRQLAAYYTLTCVDGTVYTVGPRAFGLGKPGPKNPSGRAGTDSVLDEMGRLWTAPTTCRERMWKGDDFLSLRIMRDLIGTGVVERPTFNADPSLMAFHLPRTVDPIAIWRTGENVLVRLLSCSDTTKPGPQWSAAILTGERSFQVESALVDTKNGFYLHVPAAIMPLLSTAILTRRPA